MIKHFRTAVAAALLVGVGVSAQAGPLTGAQVKTTFSSTVVNSKPCTQTTMVDPDPDVLQFDGSTCNISGQFFPFTLDIDGNRIVVISEVSFADTAFAGFEIEVLQPSGTAFAGVVELISNTFDDKPAGVVQDGLLRLNFAKLTITGDDATATFKFTTETTSVPEPASLGLAGLALAALGIAGRRRRRS